MYESMHTQCESSRTKTVNNLWTYFMNHTVYEIFEPKS
jgi:hypothetical protein